jgi:NAD(P)-dependent dehydrogenase (short-subunit alcohol dehydrogenase family)
VSTSTISTEVQPLASPQPLAEQPPRRQGWFSGKVALVTGSSSGLGQAVAAAFAAQGADLVITARHCERLESAAEALRSTGARVLAVPCDITDSAAVERLFSRAAGEFGRLDVLVNNVGRSARGRALDTTPEEFQQSLELNFLAAVRCTRLAMPQLIASRGHLVNIGSLAGKLASRYMGAYPVTKFALAAYTQQLRLELAEHGVHVLLVSPGPIARDDAGSRYEDRVDGLPASAGKPGAGIRLRGIRPEVLAEKIVWACRRRQPELVWPRHARFVFALAQLSSRLGDWILRRMT